MNKVQNNKAWWLVLPVFLLVAFSAVIPMMTVVNYSVQDIFDQSSRYFVGADWYKQVLLDPRLHDSLLRQFIYSACVLLIEIPLGIAGRPDDADVRAAASSVVLIILALPLADSMERGRHHLADFRPCRHRFARLHVSMRMGIEL
jgi:glycerol transport system permease protein